MPERSTGVISDLGEPTANMWRLRCKSREIESVCRRLSCVYPTICKNLNTDHAALIRLYRRARALPGVKKVLIASGDSPQRPFLTQHTGLPPQGEARQRFPSSRPPAFNLHPGSPTGRGKR